MESEQKRCDFGKGTEVNCTYIQELRHIDSMCSESSLEHSTYTFTAPGDVGKLEGPVYVETNEAEVDFAFAHAVQHLC